MKKLLSVLLAGIMSMSVASCGGGNAVTLTQLCDDNETMSATVTVGYKSGEGYSNEDSAEIVNEEKDFSIEFYLYYDNDLYYYVDDANTGGLAEYTRRADAAEAKIN